MTTLSLRDLGFVGGGLLTEPWTPARITTALWLDAADASTVTLNSSTVSQWNDKSGNGKNAFQATASQQPAYSATSFLGEPGITTDGVDDSLVIAGLSSQIGNLTHGVYWVFLRVNNNNVPYQPSVAGYPTNGTFDAGSLHYIKSNNTGASYPYFTGLAGSPNYDGVGTYTDNTGNIMAFQANTAGTNWEVHKNGTLESAASGINNPSSSVNGYVLGKQINPPRHGNFTFAEMIMVQSTDAATRQRIEGYLAHKWDLTANLPSGHPYKSTAPT